MIIALDAASHLSLGDTKYEATLRKGLLNFETFFWPALLVCEIILYIIIRKRIYKKLWVIFHSWFLIIAFLLVPFLFGFISYFLLRHHPSKEDPGLARQISLLRSLSFNFLIAVGHLFFILTIVKSFTKKQIEILNETPGVLDEFVG